MNQKHNYPYARPRVPYNNPGRQWKQDERVIPFLAGALIAAPLWSLSRQPYNVPYMYPYQGYPSQGYQYPMYQYGGTYFYTPYPNPRQPRPF